MPQIILRTTINAPVERCFDLSRSIDLHQRSTAHTEEKAIAGRTHGLIEPGETVTWQAKHLGFRQQLTSKITAFEYPNYFVDEMQKGIFKRLYHLHRFERDGDSTILTDDFQFTSPFGLFGRVANIVFLKRYLEKFLIQRNAMIKAYAESDQWKEFINVTHG